LIEACDSSIDREALRAGLGGDTAVAGSSGGGTGTEAITGSSCDGAVSERRFDMDMGLLARGGWRNVSMILVQRLLCLHWETFVPAA